MPPQPLVSVIVPTYNRYHDLSNCLKSLTAQADENFEIIVVDDGSTDETPKITEQFDVKLIRNEKNIGLWKARNRGIEESKAQIVTFIDDDAIADKNWLRSLLRGFTSSDVAVVTGKILPRSLNAITKTALDLLRGNDVREVNPERESIQEGNAAYRRNALIEVGLFSPGLLYHDGLDLCLRLRGKGYRIIYTPHAILYHDYARGLRHLMKKKYLIGKQKAQVERRNSIRVSKTTLVKTLLFASLPPGLALNALLPWILPQVLVYGYALATAAASAITFIIFARKEESLSVGAVSLLARVAREYGYLVNKITREMPRASR
jgi:glycosyltransferase involved in cell wall biosynthesis